MLLIKKWLAGSAVRCAASLRLAGETPLLIPGSVTRRLPNDDLAGGNGGINNPAFEQRVSAGRGVLAVECCLDATRGRVVTSKGLAFNGQSTLLLSGSELEMPACIRSHITAGLAILLLTASSASFAFAQTEDLTGVEADPIKLFERGQDAHAKGDLARALAFYEEAIKLRPEFPEAEYQRSLVLVSLDRPSEAEKSLRRAIELRKDWSQPYSALASLLVPKRDQEAEPLLRRALQLGAKDYATLDQLAALRWRAGDTAEALTLAKRATEDENAPAWSWLLRGAIERAAGDKAGAAKSLARALEADPKNAAALRERAELFASSGDYARAIEDLNIISIPGTAEEIEAANGDDPAKARPALEKLIARNPKNARLLARLGEITRTTDPRKSLECYAHANEIDPRNPDYATGYAAALVQARRFAEAVEILRRVTTVAPNNRAAHANLATALYELKRYAEALPELEWLADKNSADTAMTYYFIGSAHDFLGEYQQALPAYEKFLAHADAAKNKREIETVQIRLPILRNQIKRGKGVKRKTK